MNRKIFSYFEIAGRIASKTKGKRSFILGAIGIRADGTMVSAFNGSSEKPNRMAHAEKRLSRKLDHGAVVYVARVRLCDGEFGMAKPCKACQKALKSRNVKKVYYTIGPNEYGVLFL